MGELLAACTLLASTLKFTGSLIAQLSGDGPVRLLVVECTHKLELRAIIAGGLRILHRIDAAGGDVFKAAPRLGAYDWLAVGCRAIVPARRAPV